MDELSHFPKDGHRRLVVTACVLAVLSILILAVWWFTAGRNNNSLPGGTSTLEAVRIMYTPDGFVPKDVSVKQGMTVTFLDSDGTGMWVASDNHLEHADYAGSPIKEHCPDASGLKFDQCSKGVSYSFTFQKTGAWGYHNHEHPEAKGTITVTQ